MTTDYENLWATLWSYGHDYIGWIMRGISENIIRKNDTAKPARAVAGFEG